MDKSIVITRQFRSIIESAEGRSLVLHLKPELIDMGVGKGDQVVVSLVENGKEKSIVIEKMTERG